MPLASRTRQTARRLRTIADVQAGLASVWRRLEAGSLDVQTARALIYCGSVMIGALQGVDLEKRLEALEAAREP